MNHEKTLTLAGLREKHAEFQSHTIAPNPRALWAAAHFFSFINEELAVIGGNTNTQYQSILSHINELPGNKRQKLIDKFFGKPAGKYYRSLLHQPSLRIISTEPSRVHDGIWAVMLQLAMGDQDHILTFTQRFSDKFLQKAARRASVNAVTQRKESLGEIMQVKIRSSLKQTLERQLGDGYVMPRYLFAVEHITPSNSKKRGLECGFHLHGLIVATKSSLPHIKQALYKAAECYDNPKRKGKRSGGYRQRGQNLAVHLGEPTDNFSNRGGRKKCLSSAPDAIWADPKRYNFHWATYSAKDAATTRHAAHLLGINLGTSIFWESPGLKKESKACLGIFKLLMDSLALDSTCGSMHSCRSISPSAANEAYAETMPLPV